MQQASSGIFRSIVSGFICTLFFAPFLALAQSVDTSSQAYNDMINQLMKQRQQDATQPSEIQKSTVGAYLDVKVDPPIPAPNIPVTITIDSYLTDLYKANISWSVNGNVVLRGTGKTSFTFQNGQSGQTTYIALAIITNTGELVNKNFSFTPAGVTVMWEADTYTPPFYKGKPLLVPQADVRITAVPDIANAQNPLGSGNLVYSWKKDNVEDTNSSGYGKNSFSFMGPPPLTTTKITLNVSTLDDSQQSEMNIYLPQTHPYIIFYPKDPLLGVQYNKPFNDETTLTSKDLSLDAEPYFFSNETGSTQTIRYAWSVNGKDVQGSSRTITLRNDTGVAGTSLVSLAMRGLTRTFQTANKTLHINFTENSNSSRPLF